MISAVPSRAAPTFGNECHVTQAGQFKGFEARHPALNRSFIFSKRFVEPPAAVTTSDQQQPVQPMIVSRLIGPSDFLVDGQAHDVGIRNDQFSHASTSSLGRHPRVVLCATGLHAICGRDEVRLFDIERFWWGTESSVVLVEARIGAQA